MIKKNLEELRGVYRSLSGLAGEDLTPEELNSMIEDINWILSDKNWATPENIKKSEDDHKSGRVIVV